MKLDPRIKSEDDIFHYFNRKKAAQYIGKPGYFADYLDYFDDLDARGPRVLTEINDESGCFFSDEASISGYSYFIPEELLNKKTLFLLPKFKQYSFDEFIKEYGIGEIIFEIRNKQEKEKIFMLQYTGYSKHIYTGKDDVICLGSYSFLYDDLCNNYEVSELIGDRKVWIPFGSRVEDESELTELKEI